MGYDGHTAPSGQPSHFGLRAVQCSRPNSTSRWQKSDDSAGSSSFLRKSEAKRS